MIDGTIARKTNSSGELGAKLDTVADLVFVTASFMKILPAIHLPQWLWIWGGVIAGIKLGNIIWGFVSKKRFVSIHTIMNKITGLALFLLPLTLSFVDVKYSGIAVCTIATFAAIQEGTYVARGKQVS